MHAIFSLRCKATTTIYFLSISAILFIFLTPSTALSQSRLLESWSNQDKKAQIGSPRYLGSNENFIKSFSQRYELLEPDSLNPERPFVFDIDANGHPVYMSLDEVRSGRVIKAIQVYPMGNSGLRLTGRGQVVGVFDGGAVELDHQEFGGRVKQKDNVRTVSAHATHVTGIIAAAGINSNIKGMAYEANVDAYSYSGWASKILLAAEDEVPISNHSYGTIAGWRRDTEYTYQWRWHGDTTLSQHEDWKFGFYNSTARYHDEFVEAYPFHLFITSAGNSRSQRGPGTSPFDHEIFISGQGWVKSSQRRDENGPYDSTPPSGVAKNILTVGAASASDSDIFSIASFSSWGPTDDGRIKPDIMGVGVSVLSTLEHSDSQTNRYGNMSGTSMSSPNVAGGMVLVRQHFVQTHNYVPLASTLKALAIHSAKQHPDLPIGPDFRTGWGMMDVERATAQITKLDSQQFLIEELILTSGEKVNRTISSDGVAPLEVTIAWTDPPGRSPSMSLNPRDTILVNDIDLKLIAPDGQEHFPFLLDFKDPIAAPTTGVNWLDNVEKIIVAEPVEGEYIIELSHKKASLVNGKQIISLIGNGGQASKSFESLWWIGGSGNWSDPANWSESIGGESANRIPTAMDMVRISNHSALLNESTITIDVNAECLNFFFESDSTVSINLNNNVLQIDGSFYTNAKLQKIENGVLNFVGNELRFNGLKTSGTTFDHTTFVFDGETSRWELEDQLIVEEIILKSGFIDLSGKNIQTKRLLIEENSSVKGINLNNSVIRGIQELDLSLIKGADIETNNLEINFESNGTDLMRLVSNNINFKKLSFERGQGIIEGAFKTDTLIINSNLEFTQNAVIGVLQITGGNELVFAPESLIEINQLSLLSSADAPIRLLSRGEVAADLKVNGLQKLCYDFLEINNVSAVGEATLNAGVNSSLAGNTNGWSAKECDQVVFVDYRVQYACFGSDALFRNLSTGEFSSVNWEISTIDGATSLIKSNQSDFSFAFPSEGEFIVTITLTDSDGEEYVRSFKLNVPKSDLSDVFIFEDALGLVASVGGLSYQWYKNGILIEGATERFFEPINTGEYTVLVSNGTCSVSSSSFEFINQVVGLNQEKLNAKLNVFPNPTENLTNVLITDAYLGLVQLSLLDLMGKELETKPLSKVEQRLESALDISMLPKGIYILELEMNGRKYNKRLIKE